tara:strand:- start:964 stop:1230 length:267 start_codon:yes stop_codon:yes gene_type:complete
MKIIKKIMDDKIKLTGLWQNEMKDGGSYLNGTLGTAKVLVFKNTYKQEGSNEPDYNMYLAPKKAKEGDEEEYGASNPQPEAPVDNMPF